MKILNTSFKYGRFSIDIDTVDKIIEKDIYSQDVTATDKLLLLSKYLKYSPSNAKYPITLHQLRSMEIYEYKYKLDDLKNSKYKSKIYAFKKLIKYADYHHKFILQNILYDILYDPVTPTNLKTFHKKDRPSINDIYAQKCTDLFLQHMDNNLAGMVLDVTHGCVNRLFDLSKLDAFIERGHDINTYSGSRVQSYTHEVIKKQNKSILEIIKPFVLPDLANIIIEYSECNLISYDYLLGSYISCSDMYHF
jgi:hypothetical protein